MTTQELIARLFRRVADFHEASMQLESMTYSKVDAELDAEIAAHIEAAPDLLAAVEAQNKAIDILFAHLIRLTGKYEAQGEKLFFPSQSGQPWAACLMGNAAIAKVKGGAS